MKIKICGLFAFEWKKVYGQKLFLLLLALGFALNPALLWYTIYQKSVNYTPAQFRRMEEDISALPTEQAYEQLCSKREKLWEMEQLSFEREVSVEEEEALCPYTGDLWSERILLEDGIEEMESVLTYSSYLQEIQENSRKMTGISIFRKNSGYSLRNLEKTAKDFKKMEGIRPVFGCSRAITSATGFIGTDLIEMLLLLAVCLFLIVNEKQNGQLHTILCTARGQRETAAAKLLVMAVSVLGITLILYIQNLLVSSAVYGLGDLSRPIQSIPAYRSCTLSLSVETYLVLFSLMKLLIYLALAVWMFFLCMVGKGLLQILSSILLILGIEAAAWYLIPVNGNFCTLKYLNLVYFLQTDVFLTRYQNVNLFSLAFGLLPAALVCLLVLWSGGMVVSLLQMKGNRILGGGSFHFSFSGKRSFFLHTLSGFEYLKILKKSGGLLLLLLFLLAQIWSVRQYSYFKQADQIYYRTYLNYLAGPPSQEKEIYLEKEEARYIALQEEAAGDVDSVQLEVLKEKLRPAEAFEEVRTEYERVRDLQEVLGKELSLVYDEGYKQFLGQNPQMDRWEALLLSLLLVLLLSSVFSCDSGLGLDQLIQTTAWGKKNTLKAKRQVAFFTSFLCFLLVYVPDFVKISLEIGMHQWNAPIQSLLQLASCTVDMKLYQYFLLLYLLRLLGTWMICEGVLLVSLLGRSNLRSLLLGTILFLLPPLFSVVQLEAPHKLTLLPFLIGNRILNEWLEKAVFGYQIWVCFLGIGMIVLAEWVMRKRCISE